MLASQNLSASTYYKINTLINWSRKLSIPSIRLFTGCSSSYTTLFNHVNFWHFALPLLFAAPVTATTNRRFFMMISIYRHRRQHRDHQGNTDKSAPIEFTIFNFFPLDSPQFNQKIIAAAANKSISLAGFYF